MASSIPAIPPVRPTPTWLGALRVVLACSVGVASVAARAPHRLGPAEAPAEPSPVAVSAVFPSALAPQAMLGPLASLAGAVRREVDLGTDLQVGTARGRQTRVSSRLAAPSAAEAAASEEADNSGFLLAGSLAVEGPAPADAPATLVPWSWQVLGALPDAGAVPAASALSGITLDGAGASHASATAWSRHAVPASDHAQPVSDADGLPSRVVAPLTWTSTDSRNPTRVLADWTHALAPEADALQDLGGDEPVPSVNAEIRETMTWSGSGVLAPFLLGRRQIEDASGSAFGRSIEGAAGLCLRPVDTIEYRLQIAQEFSNQLDAPSRDPSLTVEMRLSF